MIRILGLAVVLMLSSAVYAEAPAVPAPGAVDLLAFIPPDAVVAVRARPAQLMASDLWKKVFGPQNEGYQKFLQDQPFAIDPEKDIADGVLALAIQFEDGQPKSPGGGAVLLLARDIDPKNPFKGPAQAVMLPGTTTEVFALSPSMVVYCPSPRMIVAGSPDYVAKVAAGPPAPQGAPAAAFWRKALDQPGEILIAARMPDEGRKALQALLLKMRQSVVEGPRTPASMGQFIGVDFVIRLGLEVQSATLSLDLSRKADALQLAITFASENAAAFIGSGLALMEPSVTAALPLAEGAAPAATPASAPAAAQEPIYRATYQGKEARVTVGRATVDRLVTGLLLPAVANAQAAARATASLNNLRQIAVACLNYASDKEGEMPRGFVDLGHYLDNTVAVRQNPGLAQHDPAGDYVLVALPKLVKIEKPTSTLLAYERYPAGQVPATGIGVAFVDGHCELMPADKFSQVLQETMQLSKPKQ